MSCLDTKGQSTAVVPDPLDPREQKPPLPWHRQGGSQQQQSLSGVRMHVSTRREPCPKTRLSLHHHPELSGRTGVPNVF